MRFQWGKLRPVENHLGRQVQVKEGPLWCQGHSFNARRKNGLLEILYCFRSGKYPGPPFKPLKAWGVSLGRDLRRLAWNVRLYCGDREIVLFTFRSDYNWHDNYKAGVRIDGPKSD